jgi:hypothetical protein
MRGFVLVLIGVLGAGPALAQVNCNDGLEPIDGKADSRITVTDFVKTVVANEAVITRALGDFGYGVEISYRTLDAAGQADGEYRQTIKVSFEDGGRRVRTAGEPVSTLRRVSPPKVDVDQLRDSFTLTADLVTRRDIVFSGRQKVGDFSAHVFDILPRDNQPVKGFAGRTWVRGRENQIARFCGRMEDGPFGNLRYLVRRVLVADKFWLPAAITADETIRASDGSDVHMRLDVAYSDYAAR